MATTEAQKRANAKHDKRTYSKVRLVFRKDAEINGAVIRAHALAQGESVNNFFLRAISETIERDRKD